MRNLLPWAIAIGTAAHLAGVGQAFTGVAGALLAVWLVVGAFGVILGWQRTGEVLGPVILLAIGAVFIPSFIAGILKELWATHPLLLILVLAGLGLAGGLFRWARPDSMIPLGVGASNRSGGGKAIPWPRRWRQRFS